jgi:hypothetical protein
VAISAIDSGLVVSRMAEDDKILNNVNLVRRG